MKKPMNKGNILSSVWCGMLIGLGGLGNLIVGGIPGALLFAFGLCSVVLSGNMCLYTGWAGRFDFRSGKEWVNLLVMLLLNGVGCAIVAYIASKTTADCSSIVQSRTTSPLLDVGLKAVLTGVIMHVCVWAYKMKQTFVPILIGVPLFILCGLPHCVADIFYYALDMVRNGANCEVILPWVVSVVGNLVGCNVPRILGVCEE